MADWKRPDSIPFPQIWSKFDGKRPIGKNGRIPKFRVQDMTDDMAETVVNHMVEYYLKDEPTCQNKKLASDPVTVSQLRNLWRNTMKHKLTLVCLLDNKEELGDDGLPDFAGCNMTHWRHPNGVVGEKMKSLDAQKTYGWYEKCLAEIDYCKHYNVPGYMYAYGLSVDPVYRGQGVGLELIKARFPLGKACGIKLTVTLFSANESQAIARKAGFETLKEWFYDDFKDENGEIYFKGLSNKVKSMTVMAARIV